MAEGRTASGKAQVVRPRAREVTPPPSGEGQEVVRPRARPAGREVAPEPPRAPLWSQELVLACCGALVLGPLLLAVVGSYYLFVFFGALLAAAVLVVLTAALPGPSEEEEQGAFVLSPGATAAVMAGSVLVGALAGGRAWAAPAVLLPVGAGWLALHAGLADHGPVDRAAVRGPHPNLQLAYVMFVAVVLVLLLAWFSGLV